MAFEKNLALMLIIFVYSLIEINKFHGRAILTIWFILVLKTLKRIFSEAENTDNS